MKSAPSTHTDEGASATEATVRVPREPTEAMVNVGRQLGFFERSVRNLYDAILAAAPQITDAQADPMPRPSSGSGEDHRPASSVTLTEEQIARNAVLEDVLRDLIRAADRARVKRLPVGIVRAANAAIERCFDALERRLP